VEGKIERLQMQHTKAVKDKLAAENRSRNLLGKVTTLENENEDLGRQLNDEKKATAEAKTEGKSARAEAQAARKRVGELELEVKSMHANRERTESATRAGVDQAHTLFVDAYRDLGAQTAPSTSRKRRQGLVFSGGCSWSWSLSCPS
jgi:regulator of replication initiation timing